MQSTIELFRKALEIKHASAWARDFNITPETFSMAKKQGRLSPVLAGNIAINLGEDPEHWIAVAALEAAPESELLTRLKKNCNSWRKLLLSSHTRPGIDRVFFRLFALHWRFRDVWAMPTAQAFMASPPCHGYVSWPYGFQSLSLVR